MGGSGPGGENLPEMWDARERVPPGARGALFQLGSGRLGMTRPFFWTGDRAPRMTRAGAVAEEAGEEEGVEGEDEGEGFGGREVDARGGVGYLPRPFPCRKCFSRPMGAR